MSPSRDSRPNANPFEEEEATQVVSSGDVGGFFAGRFRLDGKLGLGAVGRVMTAVDTRTGARVALKVLHKNRAGDAEVIARFQREAELLRELRHPGIVKLVDFGQSKTEGWWLAMELLEGRTMKEHLATQGSFTPRDAWPIVATICDALAYAHSKQVLHRDLKPENIILLPGQTPPCKVVDFGLSRDGAAQRITATGMMLGTPRYMAPEMLAESHTLDARIDVFSIGVILFEMLTGRSIYTADDVGSLFGAIMEGRTLRLRQVRPDALPPLDVLIAECVAKDANQRVSNADVIATRYATCLGLSTDRSPFVRGAPAGVQVRAAPKHVAAAFRVADLPHPPTPPPSEDWAPETRMTPQRVQKNSGSLPPRASPAPQAPEAFAAPPRAEFSSRPLPQRPATVPISIAPAPRKTSKVRIVIGVLVLFVAIVTLALAGVSAYLISSGRAQRWWTEFNAAQG